MYIKDIFQNYNHPHCIINVLTHDFNLFKYLNTDYKHIINTIEYDYHDNSYFFNYIHINKKKDIYKSFINDITTRNITSDLLYIYIYNFNDANLYFQLYYF